MQPPDPYLRIAVSDNGDVLISRGPAQPVLFVSRQKLIGFLNSPTNTTIAEIGGVGAAAIGAALEANSRFEVITETPLSLRLTLPNGLVIVYCHDEVVFHQPTRANAPSGDIIVTQSEARLTGKRAASGLNLRSLSTTFRKDETERRSSYAEAVTVMVRLTLRKRVSEEKLTTQP
jgi:hypothetical protein